MPWAAPRTCNHPGCRALIKGRGGHCDEHRKQRYAQVDERRGSKASRGYDAAWRRLRLLKLTKNPVCECDDCRSNGRLTPAAVVDHIRPIAERPDLRLDINNLRSMAKRCHDKHTASERDHFRG
jgi:5-methylcytosine-specific restriction enzyme A